MERVLLASSFTFRGKGYIHLQETNKKDDYRHFFSIKIQLTVRFVARCLIDNFKHWKLRSDY